MGRFESTVEFYARSREPYTPNFFTTVATRLKFNASQTLLDVGCGPGLLAIGFAPYLGACTGLDPEPKMLEAARRAAEIAGVVLRLIPGRLEEFESASRFDAITIGRALHWLDRESAVPRIEEVLVPGGRVLICGAKNAESDASPWLKAYDEFRHRWAPDEKDRYKQDPVEWFAGSSIEKVDEIEVTDVRDVSVDELVYRSLSKSNTSPAVLGEKRVEFERELRELLAPYSQGLKPLQEAPGTAALKRCPDTKQNENTVHESDVTVALKRGPDTKQNESTVHESDVTADLKRCPDTKQNKNTVHVSDVTADLKRCPDTKRNENTVDESDVTANLKRCPDTEGMLQETILGRAVVFERHS